MRINRECDSNEIDESDRQHTKQNDPRISRFRGMVIDSSDELKNASDSIRINREFDANEIDESDLQLSKHDDSIIPTFQGISNASDSI
jgi:hypothetical protein